MSGLRDLHQYLADNAAALFLALLGEPRTQSGREWRYRRKGSLAVVVAGEKAGAWKDHESDEGGGPLELIARETMQDLEGAIEWAREWAGGGLIDYTPHPRQIPTAPDKPGGQIEAARRIWAQSVAVVGTDGERYLRKRGITRGFERVRFHRDLYFSGDNRTHPAVIFQASNGAVQAVFLKGLDRIGKRTYGSLAGHAVVLQEDSGPLILCEGPETALSAVSAGVPGTVAAVLGVSNFDTVGINSDISIILLVGDGDPEGSTARRTLQKAARELLAAGKTVRVLELPPTKEDLNDILQARGPAAVLELVQAALDAPPWTDPDAKPVAPSHAEEPYYQTTPVSPANASARLEESVADWLADSCRRADAKAHKVVLIEELAPAIRVMVEAQVATGKVKPEDAQARINLRAGMQAAQQVRHAFGPDAFALGPWLQIRAAAGIGKTTVVAQAIRGIDTKRYPVWVLVPTNAKAAELTAENPGFFHVKGRTPEMCTRHELADEVAKSGASVQTSLCFNSVTGAACPYFDDCPYQAQRRALADRTKSGAGGVYVGSHEYLKVPSGAPPPALLIVDESHWKTLLATVPIDLESMTKFAQASWRERTEDTDDLAEYTENLEQDKAARTRGLEFRSALTSDLPILAEVRDRGFTPAELKIAAKRLRKRVDMITYIRPDMDDAEIRKLIEDRDVKQLAALAKLYECLADELEVTPARGSANGVEYRSPAGDAPGRVLVHYARQPNHRSGPVLLLDASADLEINRKLWGGDLQEVRIDVERCAEVVQVVGKKFSNQSLKGETSNGEPLRAEEAKQLRQEIATLVESLPGPVLIVANLGAKIAQQAEMLKSPQRDDQHFAHFGALRGLNQFEACQSAVIVGREQPSAQAIEEYARGLHRLAPEPLGTMEEHRRTNPVERTAGGRFVSSWALETRNRRMAGGGVEATAVEVHPDPRVQRFLEQIREREIEQGIDRVRLVHAMAPKTVLVLSDLVLDVTIDRTVSWHALVATGQRVAAAMEATEGVLALSRPEAQRLHGWSERVTRDTLAVLVPQNLDLRPKSMFYLVRGPGYFVEYRKAGARGERSRAWISSQSLGKARARLETVAGPLAEFWVDGVPYLAPVSPEVVPPPVPVLVTPDRGVPAGPVAAGPPPPGQSNCDAEGGRPYRFAKDSGKVEPAHGALCIRVERLWVAGCHIAALGAHNNERRLLWPRPSESPSVPARSRRRQRCRVIQSPT